MIEYKTLIADALPSEADLNRLGAEGWELTTIVSPDQQREANGYVLYLQRPVPVASMSQAEARRVLESPGAHSEATREVARQVIADQQMDFNTEN